MENRYAWAAEVAAGAPSHDAADADDACAFEDLLARASFRFACLSSDRVPDAIRDTLEQIRVAFGFDRATYCEFPGPDAVEIVCSTAARGLPALPTGRVADDMRWFRHELISNRVIALHDLPGTLPPEAEVEAERCQTQGVRAHLSVPLRAGGQVVGALSLANLSRSLDSPRDVVRRLGILGALIVTAVERARGERESRRLEERLRHAEGVARTGAMATAIAHEFSQPVAAILSNAQAGLRAIEAGRATPQVLREVLEAIVRDDRRAADSIRAIRRLVRRDDATRAPIDLGAAVRAILALLEPELRRAAIAVDLRITEGVRVLGDAEQLQQVAANLVRNAIAAMAATPAPQRALRVEVTHGGPGHARMLVEDAGCGVADADVDALFEPRRLSRPGEGGFGLTLCRAIVEAHDGDIRLVRGHGPGAAFEVDLPGLAPEAGGAPAGARPPDLAAGDADAPLVAVVDDDDAVSESVVRLLAGAGYRALAWPDGRAFLRDPRIGSALCVLLDLRMPGLRGQDVHRAMRARGLSQPVIYMSACDDVHESVEAMKAGATDFLSKPVPADVLIAVVRSAVDGETACRQASAALAARRMRFGRLTARERDVLREVLRGRLNKQIAGDLGISEPTVKQHRARVMEKMEVRTVAELIRVCDSILVPAAREPASVPAPS